ncbi:branched-chain amino acid transport system permease protein [Rhizobium mongolense subsp. loessense]|uniref:Branched-chain amino acid transport system permease protein n=1 Tax=Rhizobium mongolense subsp. loessense TaxID=158890 RepID=A0A1G4UAE5_9HYPH|nr:branched-chain amino acid ABC transporter permease [Rhizobium mongolense]SCW90628.1 branched-chain amino acid transport system permease protein [Rhizobium mongolense subsp. loessense]
MNDGFRAAALKFGLFAIVAILIPVFVPGYALQQVAIAIAYAIAILGLNLLMGFAGQICLAQGTLFGVGAYVTAILNATYGVSPLATLPAAAAAAAVVGLVIGLPALRLQGLQLAIVTFGIAAAFPQLLLKMGSLTGGVSGLPIDAPEAPSFISDSPELWLYIISLACAGLGALLVSLMLFGDNGRALRAQRDNPQIAQALGINLTRTRLWAFAVSSALAGVGGGVFGIISGFISPESFLAILSINIVIGSIVGGVTSIVGAFLGGLFMVFVPTWASDINLSLGNLIYGLALILIMMVARNGVTGFIEKWLSVTFRRMANSRRHIATREELI